MVEFDIGCRRCKKLITLRVRDERSRVLFAANGALCQVCDTPGAQRAPDRAWPRRGTPMVATDDSSGRKPRDRALG
jgi:hypothetical protein